MLGRGLPDDCAAANLMQAAPCPVPRAAWADIAGAATAGAFHDLLDRLRQRDHHRAAMIMVDTCVFESIGENVRCFASS